MNEAGSSNTWKYLGIGCAILALLGVCSGVACVACAGAGLGGIVAATEAPAEATRTFLASVRAGDVHGAYTQTATSYQAATSEEAFQAQLAELPAIAASTDESISGRQIQPGAAQMRGTLQGPSGETAFFVTLLDEGGTWRVNGFGLTDGDDAFRTTHGH